MPEKIQVGLITHGPGAHVSAYLQALAAAPHCAEVVLVDPDSVWDADAKRVLGDKLQGIQRNYQQFLAQQPPGMVLVTREASTAPPVIDAALETGCHVFAEKPSCVRAADFAPLVQKADAKHRHLMLALANRTNPEVAAARQIMRSGQIGKLYGVEMHLIADQTRLTRPSYHRQWFAHKDQAGGGHLIWLGIHWLDLAMYITGSEIAQTVGFTTNIGGQPIDVEDSAVAAWRFDSGALGTLTSGYYLDKGYHSHIKIWGSDGWIHLEPMRVQPLTWYTTQGPQAGQTIVWEGNKEPRGYSPFVSAAVQACAEMSDPPISNADSYRALKTVFAIYAAAAEGAAVTIQ